MTCCNIFLLVLLTEIEKFISNQNIVTNTYRIQAHDSMMCGYFCIRSIHFMLSKKCLTDLTKQLLLLKNNDKNIMTMIRKYLKVVPATFLLVCF